MCSFPIVYLPFLLQLMGLFFVTEMGVADQRGFGVIDASAVSVIFSDYFALSSVILFAY